MSGGVESSGANIGRPRRKVHKGMRGIKHIINFAFDWGPQEIFGIYFVRWIYLESVFSFSFF